MTRIRVLTALAIAPVAIAAVALLPTPWLAAISALVFLLGLWEWFKLSEIEDTLARAVLLLANLSLMVALVWGSQTRQGGTLVLFQIATMIGVGWWALALFWLRHYHFASDHRTHARAFKLAAGTLAVLPAWCALASLHAAQPHGRRWLLTALMVVWAADSGAYFAGRAFGRRKLAPRISPNKTLEGLAGGVAAALSVALPLALWAGADTWQLPSVALVVLAATLASVVGDLFESLLKRHVGAKDSGHLIPGHGGVLDRIDAILAALPVFALGKAIFGF